LLTPTLNQVLGLVILKTILRRKKKTINYKKTKELQQQASAEIKKNTQAATSGRLPNSALPQGRKTNIQPTVSQAKGVENVRLHTSLATVCVAVFHTNFSSPV